MLHFIRRANEHRCINSSRGPALLVAGMALLILLTRWATLTHNMQLHIDEPVFYGSAVSALTGAYAPVKPYPEGAFLLYIPFQALGAWLCQVFHLAPNPALFNRIASVLFSVLGSILGCRLLVRDGEKPMLAMAIYAVTMVFSLFQMEQSRYGTGDSISFFLMMLALRQLQGYFEEKNRIRLYAAAFFFGMLGAATLCKSRKGCAVVAVLCLLMTARGALLVGVLVTDSTTVVGTLAKHDQYTAESTCLVTGPYMPGGRPGNVTVYEINNFLSDNVSLDEYDFAVIGPYDYCRARSALFSRIGSPRLRKLSSQWQTFQEYYRPQQFAKMYPDEYYRLFGYWLYGSSATEFEFPQLYYYALSVYNAPIDSVEGSGL